MTDDSPADVVDAGSPVDRAGAGPPRQPDGYAPLEAYGAVGTLDTVALVCRDGSVDWLCLPHVESPSVFARLLDAGTGGHFAVTPRGDYESAQSYVDGTNVLQTGFRTDTGVATVTDFASVPGETAPSDHRVLYRRLTGDEGTVDLNIAFDPRFDYARTAPTLERTAEGIAARGDDERLVLSGDVPLKVGADGAAGSVSLSAGETRWLALGDDRPVACRPPAHRDQLEAVVDFWRDWCRDGDAVASGLDPRWHELAERSALVLKLLIHRQTGAIAAAPTTSLPEDPGGVRNWDYRYNWIRDASFTVRALAELDHLAEARDYFEMCLDHCSHGSPADIQPVYGLHGARDVAERTLDHLEGYRGSTPVRVGNDAASQRQLDVYGELVVGVDETVRYGVDLLADHWDLVRDVADHVCDVWREPDVGIWEVRSGPERFVHSKVMCWAALDRAVGFVESGDVDGDVSRWRRERDAVREAVLERGFDAERGSFVRSFEADDRLDAALLRLPLVGFLPADDPRMLGTVDAVADRLLTGDGLVHRLEGDDGLPGEEGAFVVCSFWLVSVLARAGRVDEARALFEQVVGYANPLGLLAEEVDPATGRQVGNVPQAFSHVGLVNAALALGERGGDAPGAGDVRTGDDPYRADD